MNPAGARILQIGHGAFGPVHLDAWSRSGRIGSLIVAEPDPAARARAARHRLAPRVEPDFRRALADVDAVTIVSPTDTHHALASAVLAAGKPLFIEKPVAATLAEALDLADKARSAGVVVRGGYYFRHHPKTRLLAELIAAGKLGKLRVLQGRFAGFKRTRADAGALLNDAVHFIDLFVWLLGGALPRSVHAVTRDHFGRGREDFVALTLNYRDGPVALIEAGCVQPGRWPDAVVPGALTSKEIAISGSRGGIEIDYAGEAMRFHAVGHVRDGAIWRPNFEMPSGPGPTAAAADPVAVVAAELAAFLDAIASHAIDPYDGIDGGVAVARILEAAQISATRNQVVTL